MLACKGMAFLVSECCKAALFIYLSLATNKHYFFLKMKKRQYSDGKKIHTPRNKSEPSAETVAVRRHL